MEKKKLFLILAGLLLSIIAQAQTQTLVVWLADGTTANVELYTEPKVTFSADKMFIKSSVLDIEYKATDVIRFTYKGKGTSINTLESEADYSRDEEQIVFHGLTSSNEVAVYKTNGIRVPIRLVHSGSDVILSLKQIPQGVYLLKVNGKTSKFTKL